jgi:hypothetical protein
VKPTPERNVRSQDARMRPTHSLVDTTMMERLHDLLPDFEQWVEQIEDRHGEERRRLAAGGDKAERDRAQAPAGEAHERHYRQAVAARDDAKADLLLGFVQEGRAHVDAPEVRRATRWPRCRRTRRGTGCSTSRSA